MRTLIAAVLALGLVPAAWAAEDSAPDPSLSPERVVAIQLEALQTNDEPEPDAGIERAWAFAHPQNKRQTGPLERFTAMLKSPAYAPLIDHRRHRIGTVERSDQRAVLEVTVTSRQGRVLNYVWVVAPIESGEQAGAWMTIQVSPPVDVGNAV